MRRITTTRPETPPKDDVLDARLGNQTAWAMVSELLMFVSMIVSFLVLPLRLTEIDYGVLGAIQGLLSPAIQLSTLGAPALFIRRIAQSSDVHDSWRRLLSVTGLGTALATVLLVLFKPVLLGSADLLTYVLLVLGGGAIAAHGDYAFALFMGLENLKDAALSRLLIVVPRIGFAIAFLLVPNPSLRVWAVMALAAGALGLLLNLLLVRHRLQLPMKPHSPRMVPTEVKQGYGFALTGISDGVLNASDRPIMVNSGFGAAAGSYTLAYRVLSLALMPSLALMRASTRRLFAEGKEGMRGPYAVALKLARPISAVGIVVGAGLWFGSPLSSLVLGEKFPEFVDIIRWLAVLPLVKSLQFVFGNALDAALFQMWRFRLTLTAAGVNLALNLVLIPRYSWRAAVGTTVAAEVLLTTTTIFACWYLARRETS